MAEFGKKVTDWYKILSVKDCHCNWSGYRISFSNRAQHPNSFIQDGPTPKLLHPRKVKAT